MTVLSYVAILAGDRIVSPDTKSSNTGQSEGKRTNNILSKLNLHISKVIYSAGLSKCKLQWVACKVNEPQRGSCKLC